MVKKIISGGLTVADQAVLDAAISLGIPYAGYMPWGRITEIGRLPSKYNIKELNTDDHLYCIERNVKESTGTLIISAGELNDGSKYARKESIKHSHQIFVVDVSSEMIDHYLIDTCWVWRKGGPRVKMLSSSKV